MNNFAFPFVWFIDFDKWLFLVFKRFHFYLFCCIVLYYIIFDILLYCCRYIERSGRNMEWSTLRLRYWADIEGLMSSLGADLVSGIVSFVPTYMEINYDFLFIIHLLGFLTFCYLQLLLFWNYCIHDVLLEQICKSNKVTVIVAKRFMSYFFVWLWSLYRLV